MIFYILIYIGLLINLKGYTQPCNCEEVVMFTRPQSDCAIDTIKKKVISHKGKEKNKSPLYDMGKNSF